MVLEALFLGRFKIPKDDIRSLLEQYRFKSLLEMSRMIMDLCVSNLGSKRWWKFLIF